MQHGKPVGLIIYFDEVTPTDALSTKLDRRQIQAVYWTLTIFEHLFCFEEVWFVLACARSWIVKDKETSMCAFIKELMVTHFFAPTRDLRYAGMLLDVGEGAVQHARIFIKHKITIADFKALKEVLLSMGHQGLKPCPMCKNVCVPTLADGVTLVSFKALELEKWKPHTDASLKSLLLFLRSEKARIGATEFGALESRMGFHYNDNHIILEPHLAYAPISTLQFDWPTSSL